MGLATVLSPEDIAVLIVCGVCIVVLGMLLPYWAAKHRSDNQLRIAQEATKQANLNHRAAELYNKAAATNLKAAELNARTP